MTYLSTCLWFSVGLTLRLALIAFVEPIYATSYYIPFLETGALSPTPWSVWLQAGGALEAFPYGYAMWAAFLPLTWLTSHLNFPIIYGYMASLLIVDLCLLTILRASIPERPKLLMTMYWCSPVVIIATYGLGLNDILPASLLMASAYLLKNSKVQLSAVVMAVAISAKISMVIATPIFLIYLYNNNNLKNNFLPFSSSLLIASIILHLPFVVSRDAMAMLFGNPQLAKILSLKFDIGQGIGVFAAPLGYLLFLYVIWRTRRLNYDLFLSILALAFLFMVLITTGSPAWFLWALPFLFFYQAKGDRVATVIICTFTLLFAADLMLQTHIDIGVADIGLQLYGILGLNGFSKQPDAEIARSAIKTALIAVGTFLGYRVWRDTIKENNFFKISRNPFLIGIAGDSGSGKDTFANSLVDLFGVHSTECVHGDDYHLWDRGRPVWQALTHLNPMANDIDRLCQDVLSLMRGKAIRTRHYSHTTGLISKPRMVKSNDLIIVSGLHSLSTPILRNIYNLSVYLDMEEKLRQHLKIIRDVKTRGYSRDQAVKAILRREVDAQKFIKPQQQHADLIFSIGAVDENFTPDAHLESKPRLCLKIETRHSDKMTTLYRALVGFCGLHVDFEQDGTTGSVKMLIEGEVFKEDIAAVVQMICPDTVALLNSSPKYHDGVLGVMQLVSLCHIDTEMKLKRYR